MRILKMLLIALLAVVGGLYALTTVNQRFSGVRVPPTIQCDSELLEVSVQDADDVLLSGVTASDRQDGDLTEKILIQGISKLISNDTAKITYLVFDSDGNAASCTRRIRYTDYERPHFTIQKPLIYGENEDIELLDRLTAVDVLDGDLTDAIRVSTLSGSSEPEVRNVTVQATNSMGDTARLTLPLVVYSGTAVRPEVVLKERLVYLQQGASFRAGDYLSAVTTPTGPGDTGDVQITGQVDTANPGTYYVYYRYPYSAASGLSVLTVVVE